MHEAKLSEEILTDPVQDVFEVLVVIEDVLIASEKLIEKLEFAAFLLELSAGLTDEIVGAVVSITNVFTLNALLAFPAESVTVMVQL